MRISLRIWIGLAAIVGGFFFISQLVEIPFRSALRGYDNTFNYLWLRSAMVDGDWDFRNDIAECETLDDEYRAAALALPETGTGRIPNKYGVGWAVLTLPFYLVADVIVAISRALGVTSLERDGFNWVYQVSIQTGHAALALLGLVLAARTIGRWLGDSRAAALGVLAVWAASPLLYYQTVNLSMSHSASFVLVAMLAWSLERASAVEQSAVEQSAPNLRWWLVAGATLGLAAVTRFQLAVFGILVVFAVLRPPLAGAVVLKRIGIVVAGALPFLLLQLWAWRVVYGRWLVFTYGSEGEAFYWTSPEILKSLFSPWHGLFYWHPLLLVALVGTVLWAWTRRGSAVGWCAAVACTIYINAAWWCWWFASSFGNRGFDAAILPLMAGMAWLFLRARGRWRSVFACVVLCAAAWNVYLVLLYRSGAISRHEPLTWSEMIEAAEMLPEALRF